MESWFVKYQEAFEDKPDEGEVEWCVEMTQHLIRQGLGYSVKNIRFEKDKDRYR